MAFSLINILKSNAGIGRNFVLYHGIRHIIDFVWITGWLWVHLWSYPNHRLWN